MSKIIYLKESKTKGHLVVGVINGGEREAYTVSAAVYSTIGSPLRGTELDEDTLAALKEASNSYKALKKALSLLSYADNSERNLRLKLMRAGFSRDISEETVREVVRLGYINESAQLERLILSEANGNLQGPMKIILKLVAKGYSVSSVKRVIEALENAGEIDFDENKNRLLESKISDEDDTEKKYKLLRKYGYRTY